MSYISNWLNGTAKIYPITPDRKRISLLYKKRIKDNELVEIGYQTKGGWKLHKPEPTPKVVADFLNKKGNFECMKVSSYYPGTYIDGGFEIMTPNFPEEVYVNEKEVIGFVIDDCYVYYDDFEHPTTKKDYKLGITL